MDIMGVAESKMNEMSALSQKYIDYRPVNPSEVRYRDVQNDFEKEMASKVANGVTWLIAIVGIAFTASGILGVSTGKTALGIIIILMGLGISIYGIITAMSKVQVAYGRAVWKNFRYNNTSGARRTKMYFASVIIDEPEKIIVRDIQTSKEDYEKIIEGTPMMIIKKGGVYHTKVY